MCSKVKKIAQILNKFSQACVFTCSTFRSSAGYLEIFETIQKSSRLLNNLPDCPEHFLDCPEIFHTVSKFSRLFKNSPDFGKIFQIIHRSSRLSGNLSQTVYKSFRLSRKFWDSPGNLPNCLEIFQTVQKYSIFLTEGFFSEMIFQIENSFTELAHWADSV